MSNCLLSLFNFSYTSNSSVKARQSLNTYRNPLTSPLSTPKPLLHSSPLVYRIDDNTSEEELENDREEEEQLTKEYLPKLDI